MATFSTIPTLRLSDARSADTKPAFLASLRSALLHVGFFYLSETGLPEPLVDNVIAQCHAFFEELSDEEKLRIEMKNEKSFLGYSRLGGEVTAGSVDNREQLDLVSHPIPSFPPTPPSSGQQQPAASRLVSRESAPLQIPRAIYSPGVHTMSVAGDMP